MISHSFWFAATRRSKPLPTWPPTCGYDVPSCLTPTTRIKAIPLLRRLTIRDPKDRTTTLKEAALRFMKFTKALTLSACVLLMAGFAVAAPAPAQEQVEGAGVAVPSGAPLTEGEIIILLQAKVPGDVIQKFVTTRGVGFVSTKEVSRKILAAGGSVGLIGTINLNQKEDGGSLAETFDPKKKR